MLAFSVLRRHVKNRVSWNMWSRDLGEKPCWGSKGWSPKSVLLSVLDSTEKLWKNGNGNGKKVPVLCHYQKFCKSFNANGGNHEISTEK